MSDDERVLLCALQGLVRRAWRDPEVLEEALSEVTRLVESGGSGRLMFTLDIKAGAAAAHIQVIGLPARPRTREHKPRRIPT